MGAIFEFLPKMHNFAQGPSCRLVRFGGFGAMTNADSKDFTIKLALFVTIACLPLPGAPPSFKDVAPILAANCSGCHSASAAMGKLDLSSYDSLRKGGHTGPAILPGKSAESLLVLRITGATQPSMPLGGKKLADGEIDIIRQWIDAGAPGPAPGEAISAPAPAIPDIKPSRAVKPLIAALAFRPDGKLLALGTFQEIRLVEPETGKLIATLPGEAEDVRAVAFSPDGKLLAAAGGLPAQRGEVRIWDVASRTPLRTITGHTDCIYSARFSPDGKALATASYDKLIKLWDVASGKEVRTLKDHIDAVFSIAFTPDGKRLVSASADRGVKIWDVASGERLYTLSEPTDGLNTLALDPAGKRVAAGGLDRTIRIWSLGEKSGTLLNSLIAHEDAILQLAWSPDGNYIVSTSADKEVKMFKAADLTVVKTWPQPDWPLSAQFAPDGKSFAVGRFDGSYEIYHLASN